MGDVPTKKRTVSLEVLTQLQEQLGEMPDYEPTHVSKQQAIAQLADAIDSMRAKNYRWSDVAAWLTEHGIPISVASLRTYMRRAAEAKAREKERTRARKSTRHHP